LKTISKDKLKINLFFEIIMCHNTYGTSKKQKTLKTKKRKGVSRRTLFQVLKIQNKF